MASPMEVEKHILALDNTVHYHKHNNYHDHELYEGNGYNEYDEQRNNEQSYDEELAVNCVGKGRHGVAEQG